MNQWPEEPRYFTQAIALGQLAACLACSTTPRKFRACQTASDSLQTNPVSERCVTLAHWYLEDGDLEQAEAWIRKADDLSSSRRAAVSMLLDIQRGELEAARTTLDPWLQGRVPSHLAQLAIQIGQATDDEALLQRWRSKQPPVWCQMAHFSYGFNPWTAPSTPTAIGRSFENPFPQLNRYRVS